MDAEFQSRKEKGLCFCCDEKYSVGHYCKEKNQRELRFLLVNDNIKDFEVFEDANDPWEPVELQTTTIENTVE